MKVGVITPRLAATAPGMPAAWIPAKVAQFMPSGPGVISAIAIMSVTSAAVIQPWPSISLVMSGIIDRPPKLVKPILTKLQKRLSSTIAAASLPYAAEQQPRGYASDDEPDTVDVEEEIGG